MVPKARKEEPRFTEKLLSMKIMEGETIALKVRAAGEPVPKLTWLKVRSESDIKGRRDSFRDIDILNRMETPWTLTPTSKFNTTTRVAP